MKGASANVSVGDSGYVKWFSELSNKDVLIAGGKGASLAEMYNSGFPIPPGFMITAQAYEYFVEKTGIKSTIDNIIDRLNVDNTAELERASKEIRAMIEGAQMPADLQNEILEAYGMLDANKSALEQSSTHKGALDILRNSHEPPFVAVRSSATTEDLAGASFAGQQDSFLAVKGNKSLLEHVKMCMSSLFTARAIYYRKKKGFAHAGAKLAVVIQKMIDSQKSGVIFSKNPLHDDGNVVVEAVWGLGEGIVSGQIIPDHYTVKDEEITSVTIAEKKIAIVRTSSGKVESVNLSAERSKQQVLSNYEIKRLAYFALKLEEHYKKPQDIEFAISEEGIFVVQSRPITTKASAKEENLSGTVLLNGLGASPGVASGVVRIIHDLDDLAKVKNGDILVTKMTNPDMVVSMQKASGIITDEGGITSHASIVSREMGIPAVVGTKTATHTLKDGQMVTVDGSSGKILEGHVEGHKKEIKKVVPTRTKIKVIVDLPDFAGRAAECGAKAVGLTRLEGIIASGTKHPAWYLRNNNMKDYISLIATGIKKIAGHFESVWVRTSDIRSDEYRNLEGAPQEVEGNPMLGNHGIRFSLQNVDLLEAEFAAMKEIADEFPHKNIGIMLPQVISLSEVTAVKEILDGMQMPRNVSFGVMIETPAAVHIIKSLCEAGISFISFGTNDLTQYTLAIDRNNPDIQNLYNEMHPAILSSIRVVIRQCKKYNVETSICGQAGSREDMVSFLIREGIDSISVNADAAFDVSTLVQKLEQTVPQITYEVENTRHMEQHSNSNNEGITHANVHHAPAIVHMQGETISDEFPIAAISESEEDIILSALEDDYSPGLPKMTDVPSLNDAIPVESAHFDKKREDTTVNIF